MGPIPQPPQEIFQKVPGSLGQTGSKKGREKRSHQKEEKRMRGDSKRDSGGMYQLSSAELRAPFPGTEARPSSLWSPLGMGPRLAMPHFLGPGCPVDFPRAPTSLFGESHR